ncbi:hypothetical protein [Ulvibacter antarcticus]|uniref:Uncharacterized protein n=1 Tax=Ulvibacter antarcticus TaxID=442714 RepID=A0A3L9YIJ6_9FLAO|nr:hypothetical protein [Ulvibacter antarcticus]RMA57758.1 hypothetical protein BXY75_2563 [Ulvibacter antarcticus]
MKSFKRRLFVQHRKLYNELAFIMMSKIDASFYNDNLKQLEIHTMDLLRTA